MTKTLSFVMTARNDDYGGNLLHRMQTSIDSILYHGERHGLDGELVLVEWNPPPNATPLADALDWPDELRSMSARVVTVPAEIHQRFPNSDKLPLFEYIAKNAGIRRAAGEFVLSTNPDLVYSDALVRFFAGDNLRSDRFYRTHRYDVDRLVPLDASVDERESIAESHVFKYSTVNDGYATVDKSTRFREEYRRFRSVVSKNPAKARFVVTDPGRVYAFLAEIYGNVFSEAEDDASDDAEVVVNTPESVEDIFLTSSGDFLLMASDCWDDIHGYPELDTNLHVDSFGCVYATKLGLDQAVLKEPLKIYHQEHDRSARDTRPAMEREELVADARRILSSPELELHNDESWGLADETLDVREVA